MIIIISASHIYRYRANLLWWPSHHYWARNSVISTIIKRRCRTMRCGLYSTATIWLRHDKTLFTWLYHSFIPLIWFRRWMPVYWYHYLYLLLVSIILYVNNTLVNVIIIFIIYIWASDITRLRIITCLNRDGHFTVRIIYFQYCLWLCCRCFITFNYFYFIRGRNT